MRCVALFPLGNMQHFQEGFNRLSQTLFWTRVLLDIMYAKAPYSVIQRAVHIHPTVSELIPTVLGDLEPMD